VVAPFVPPALAVALATLPISIGWQETIVNSVVGAMTIAALALSIWGATVIKVWLKTLPVSGSAVFGLPLIAVTFIATAQHVARTLPMGPENGMTHHATQTVSTFLGVWTVLVAYQGKFFWDRAVEAWEKDGLRSLVRAEAFQSAIQAPRANAPCPPPSPRLARTASRWLLRRYPAQRIQTLATHQAKQTRARSAGRSA
jgi:hypothetical protein